MLRYDRQPSPGLVALYDIRPQNGAGLTTLEPARDFRHGKGKKESTWRADGQDDSQSRITDHAHDELVMQVWHARVVDVQNSITDVQSSAAVSRALFHYLTYKWQQSLQLFKKKQPLQDL